MDSLYFFQRDGKWIRCVPMAGKTEEEICLKIAERGGKVKKVIVTNAKVAAQKMAAQKMRIRPRLKRMGGL